MSKRHWTIAAIIMVGISAAAPALASQMVYHPVNPTFGGNPLNGSSLLSTAQAQGEGVKSGAQGPDLSGLTDALKSNIGAGSGNGSGGNGGGSPTVVVVTPP